MGKLHRIRDTGRSGQRHSRQTFFNRAELNQLLSLYSRRVMNGEWRDYAIDQEGDRAVFSIYRRSHERPLYTIAKRAGANGRSPEYLVCRDQEHVARTASLAEALATFRPAFQVIG